MKDHSLQADEQVVDVSAPGDTGLEVLDLDRHPSVTHRPVRVREATLHMEALRRLAQTFVENPDTILQELTNAALEVCGADSAGISIERSSASDEQCYDWVATAGAYAPFLDAILPRSPVRAASVSSAAGPSTSQSPSDSSNSCPSKPKLLQMDCSCPGR